jgi:UDP-glucose:O-linked fucose beta-1,3-glucosyltransferase
LQARKNEHQTEEHLKSIADRENGRLHQENQKLLKQLEELKEKRNLHEVCY